MSIELTLRQATPADRAFMEAVYFETQRWIVERLFGWRGDDIEAAKFAEFYDERNSSIVVFDGTDIGWLTLVRGNDGFELDGIYIAADHQRKGYGTDLIRRFIEEATAAGVPVRLSAAKINPALALYRRLGFEVVREDEFKTYMERPQSTRNAPFQLQRPHQDLAASFVRMRDAFIAAGEDQWNGCGEEIAHSDPIAYVDLLNERSRGREVAEDLVRADSFWILEAGEVVGSLGVRHVLTEQLKKAGGHIGYATHPAHRGRGVAAFALISGLNVLRHLGVEEALVTCKSDNPASLRVIEKCGGRRIEDSVFPERPELGCRRYTFALVEPVAPRRHD